MLQGKQFFKNSYDELKTLAPVATANLTSHLYIIIV